MSVSTSGLARELKGLLGVDTNAAVLQRVQKLRRPQAGPVIVAVVWQPGEPGASVSVLSGQDGPMTEIAEALRRGEATVMAQMEQIAAQAQSEVARLRVELEKASARDGHGSQDGAD